MIANNNFYFSDIFFNKYVVKSLIFTHLLFLAFQQSKINIITIIELNTNSVYT